MVEQKEGKSYLDPSLVTNQSISIVMDVPEYHGRILLCEKVR